MSDELVEVWRKQFELMIGDENIKKNAKPFNVVGYSHLSPKEGTYRLPSIEAMWQGFLMAKRSQPVIELPEILYEWDMERDSDQKVQYLDYENTIHSITSAGYQYKVKE